MSLAVQRLAITGMVCAGCVNSVTRVLSGVPGVTDVRVTLETGRADVSGTASSDVLAAAVRKAGYGADVA
jgi:copper chaperone CopZ